MPAVPPEITLYLIRHGIAVDRHPDHPDRDRPLTAKGRQKTQRVAERLVQLGIHAPLILTSPLVRAYQTAEILLSAGVGEVLEIEPELAPGGQCDRGLEHLARHLAAYPATAIALIGHEPDLSQWASLLMFGDRPSSPTASDPDPIQLKKAGVIGLTVPVDPAAGAGAAIGHSQLIWLTPPRFLLG